MAILVSSTQTPQHDTAHLSDTHLSFRVLASSKQIFPANKRPLLCGLSSFSPALQRSVQLKQVHSLFMYHHTFPSPLRRDIPIISVYLPARLPADFSHVGPWSAVQYRTERTSSVRGFPYSILQQEATQFLQDSKTPAKARMLPLVKRSLKMKEPFLQ